MYVIRHIKLLSMLCKHNGVPVATNQNLVFELFLQPESDIFLRAESDGRILYDDLETSTSPIYLDQLTGRFKQHPELLSTDLRQLNRHDCLFAFQLEVQRVFRTCN